MYQINFDHFKAGNYECMEFLFANFSNISVDHQNQSGFSALMKAAIQGIYLLCEYINWSEGARKILKNTEEKYRK